MNRGRKILVSQILENPKNPNLVSANNAIIHQIRLEDFKQNIEEFDNCTNH